MPEQIAPDLGERLALAIRGVREYLIRNPDLLSKLAASELCARRLDERLARQTATASAVTGEVPEQVFIDAARADAERYCAVSGAAGIDIDETARLMVRDPALRTIVESAYRAGQATTPDGPRIWTVLAEIAAERARQDAKWGEQNHRDGTGRDGDVETARLDRAKCKANVPDEDNWRDILQEEVSEAFAETDPKALRAELIQVAAVAAQWAEAIDRRTTATADVQDGGGHG